MQKRDGPWIVDTATLQRAGGGDDDAFRKVVDRYYRPAVAVASEVVIDRHDAEDITQETFVRMRPALADFERSAGFYAWLRRIIRNASVDEIRRRRARRASSTVPFDDGIEELGAPAGPEERAMLKDDVARVVEALKELSPEFREALLLRSADDMTYAEIANHLRIPIGTVMSRLHAARSRLRVLLNE
jgi:RNA polymerase sigma-70 factor (ECF subfamily)